MSDLDRIRWRSRRGLLELDIIFSRFIEKKLDTLSSEEIETYKDLLLCQDNDLLDWVNGKTECNDPRLRAMLDKIQATSAFE